MKDRLALLAGIGRQALGTPDKAAHGLVLRDLEAWLRLQFLGVAARTGIADRLPAKPHELGLDPDLTTAFLELGAAIGELRKDKTGAFHIKGRRFKAVAKNSPDLRGLVEELLTYDSPIYTNLDGHLRGAPKGDYLDGLGDVVARASRLAEPLLAPLVRQHIAAAQPRSVLDVGCGTGIYVQHAMAAAPPHARVLGIDIDADAVANAVVDPAHVRQQDLFDVDEQFDVVLLLQNVYYWPPEERPRVVAKLKEIATHSVVVATAIPEGQAFNRHFDLVLRVTEANYPLPTKAELAGLGLDVTEPVPGVGFAVATWRRVHQSG